MRKSAFRLALPMLAIGLAGSVLAQDGRGPSALPSDLSPQLRYEVERAHARLREYVPEGQPLLIFDEELRTFTGQRGSTMTVYCGRTQSRMAGSVSVGRFYYVLEVTPAGNLLSDYERGAWSNMTDDSPDEEYRKLCQGPASALDDLRMLTSGTRTASGSRFRPFVNDSGIADRDWLIGSWVEAGGCATDANHRFDADGTYHGYERLGRWSLAGNIVTIRILRVEDESGDRALPRPRIEAWRVARTGIDTARFRDPGGASSAMIRC